MKLRATLQCRIRCHRRWNAAKLQRIDRHNHLPGDHDGVQLAEGLHGLACQLLSHSFFNAEQVVRARALQLAVLTDVVAAGAARVRQHAKLKGELQGGVAKQQAGGQSAAEGVSA